jgi:hypothetical protein
MVLKPENEVLLDMDRLVFQGAQLSSPLNAACQPAFAVFELFQFRG